MASSQLQDRLAKLKQKLASDNDSSSLRATVPRQEVPKHSMHSESAQPPLHHDRPFQRDETKDCAELDGLRSQVSELQACIRGHEVARAELVEAKEVAQKQVDLFKSELAAANQKLTVLKEQLMRSQTDAEESGKQMAEDAAHELHAKHEVEVGRLNATVEEQRHMIHKLELRLNQQAAENHSSMKSQEKIDALHVQAAEAERRATLKEQEALAIQEELRRKAQELGNLERAMGELTYEAERVQKLELQMCQSQEEARQANEGARHAQGVARAAAAEAEHERNRASEQQVRCLQLEQQLESVGREMLAMRTHSEQRDQELERWQKMSISPDNRDGIVSALVELMKGEGDASPNLEKIGHLLQLGEAEMQQFTELCNQMVQNRSLLQRIKRIPGRWLGSDPQRLSHHADKRANDNSIANSWAHFLTDMDEADSANGTQASESTQREPK